MGLLSKKEFAERCGIKANDITTYIKRGKIIINDAELIDDSVEKNRAFIEKRQGKFKTPAVVVAEPVKVKVEPVKVVEEKAVVSQDEDVNLLFGAESQSYTESERQLKYLDTLKRKKEIEKLDIDIAKKRGEVVPTELISPVFLQHNQSIVTEFKNAADEIIRIFSKRKGLSVNEVAEINGLLVSCINSSISKATDASVKAVDNIINEFSEKKGVGERG